MGGGRQCVIVVQEEEGGVDAKGGGVEWVCLALGEGGEEGVEEGG